jgi:ribosomal protein S18 acetylase RimI-like enzyme
VSLRPFGKADLSEVGSWYEGRRLEEARSEPNVTLLAVTNREDDAPIGVVGYSVGSPEGGWLSFDFVAVEPRLRGLGLESEAVRLLEEEMVEKGRADRFWSGVRQDDGPALYFWLRLGYGPTAAAESPWPGSAPHDMMAMVRKSENPIPAHEVGS